MKYLEIFEKNIEFYYSQIENTYDPEKQRKLHKKINKRMKKLFDLKDQQTKHKKELILAYDKSFLKSAAAAATGFAVTTGLIYGGKEVVEKAGDHFSSLTFSPPIILDCNLVIYHLIDLSIFWGVFHLNFRGHILHFWMLKNML